MHRSCPELFTELNDLSQDRPGKLHHGLAVLLSVSAVHIQKIRLLCHHKPEFISVGSNQLRNAGCVQLCIRIHGQANLLTVDAHLRHIGSVSHGL